MTQSDVDLRATLGADYSPTTGILRAAFGADISRLRRRSRVALSKFALTHYGEHFRFGGGGGVGGYFGRTLCMEVLYWIYGRGSLGLSVCSGDPAVTISTCEWSVYS